MSIAAVFDVTIESLGLVWIGNHSFASDLSLVVGVVARFLLKFKSIVRVIYIRRSLSSIRSATSPLKRMTGGCPSLHGWEFQYLKCYY